jgi:sortase A
VVNWPLALLGVALTVVGLAVASVIPVSMLTAPEGTLIGEEAAEPEPKESERGLLASPREFKPVPEAIMTLTIPSIGLREVPVVPLDNREALIRGVAHEPETSLPWDKGAQRNVYLAGHRLGWPGTRGRLIFYDLDDLDKGDEVLLEDDSGNVYRYRVSEKFVVEPTDVWVMGQVRDRDLVTLQTCTLPDLEKRLIVRAERVEA